MPNWNPPVRMYMKEHMSLFVFVSVLLVTGVVFGAVMVNALTLEQKQEIGRHLGSFFHTLDQSMNPDGSHTFRQLLGTNLKWLVLIWLLGLSVVGLPLIFALDFLKGVLIGFTVGYLVGQYSWKGMLFAFVAVVPQNVFMIPSIIVCSAMGMAFSLFLVRNRFVRRDGSVYQAFLRYSTTTAAIAVIVLIVSMFEAYVSPNLMKTVTGMLVSPQ